ncbi:MAG: hypothetical protein ABI679_09375 [Gemmatimonadota bacterium]
MTCTELSERLDRYHAGLLPTADAENLEQHLLSCEFCRAEFRFQRGLRAQAEALPRAISPARDLWDGISSRITRTRTVSEPRPAWWQRKPLLVAAAIALMALASGTTAAFLTNHDKTVSLESAGVTSFRMTEAAYRVAADELTSELARKRSRLTSAQIAVIEHNLRIIDEAIRETQAALALQPGNHNVADLLWASYEKKIDLLQRAASDVEL